MKNFLVKTVIFILAILLCFSGCEGENQTSSTPLVIEDIELPSADFNAKASASKQVNDADTTINLKNSTVEISGNGAAMEGTDIVITRGGSYAVSGNLENGRIVISAGNSTVNLILNGVDISSNYSSTIFVQKAGEVIITAFEGSVNLLKDANDYDFTDNYSNSDKSEPDACIYSDFDLLLNGTGELLVKGNYKNGITSKTVLNIEQINLSVSSAEHGITGKEQLNIKKSAFNVNAGCDGLRANSTANSTLGKVNLSESTGIITSGEDGIQAETTLNIESGNYSVTSGGGSENELTSEVSSKALKGGNAVYINGGVVVADSSDDALHSNGYVNISGGNITVKSGDDAIHADDDIEISGGIVIAEKCYEGLEANDVNVSGGEIKLIASDDGVNISGGDGSGEMARPGMDFFGSSGGKLLVSGGRLVVNAEGDGFDANGDIEISGGTVIVNGPTRGANGVLDYDGEFLVTGGELIAVGTSGMAQNPSENSSQNSLVFTNFSGSENEIFSIISADGTELISYVSPKNFDWFCYSSANIKNGESYTAYIGGTHSGTSSNGVFSDGKYSSGEKIDELTVSTSVTANGSGGGFGGSHGMGGFHGNGRPEGRPNGDKKRPDF